MRLISAFVGLVIAVTDVSAQDTLPEVVKRHQTNIETQVRTQQSPAIQIDELVRACDVIARVLVLGGEFVRLREDQRVIETDYSVLILDDVFAARRLAAAGDVVVVTKPGGTLTIEGYQVTTVEVGFPPFQNGEEYILFMNQNASSSTFRVAIGAQGAFRNIGGVVEQISSIGVWNYEKDGQSIRTPIVPFLSELRQRSAASR